MSEDSKALLSVATIVSLITGSVLGVFFFGCAMPHYYANWQLEAVRTGHAEYYLTTNQPPERAWRWKARSHE